MIDIHNHLLPNLDDGPKDIETAVEMAKTTAQLGFTHILCSPHIITSHYDNTKNGIQKACDSLQQVLNQNQIPIQLIPFAEIYLDETIPDRIKALPSYKNKVLVEGPFHAWPAFMDVLLFKIASQALTPIIAHAERCVSLTESIIESYVRNGYHIQLNLLSIIGAYGEQIEKRAERLLQKNLVHYIATDMHNTKLACNLYEHAMIKIRTLIGKKKLKELWGANLDT